MEVPDIHCTLKGVKVISKYSCTLNQTNIAKNSNKFYILQILSDDEKYYLWTRYGRVGDKGVYGYKEFTDLPKAKAAFEKQFKTKTGNQFGNTFHKKSGKYMLVELESTSDPVIVPEADDSETDVELEPEISEIIQKIGSSKMMTNTLVNMEVDTKKMPLGKISKKMIAEAHKILKYLSTGTLSSAEIIDKSSEFWTIVPYATKRNVPPPVLENTAIISQCSQLLDTLENIGIADTILQRSNSEYSIYKSLGITLIPLEKGRELTLIKRYVKNTCATTHHYNLELLGVYKIEKPEQDNLDPEGIFDSTKNHQLLFHGSRMANFMGILSQGLRLPQLAQVANGSTLGRGIYFADVVTKSYNYTYAYQTEHTGFMVLCEVALGKPHIVYGCCEEELRTKYDSRWAKGNSTIDEDGYRTLPESEILVPCGKIVDNPEAAHSTFLYNEYVIYRPEQYRFRYLLYLKDS